MGGDWIDPIDLSVLHQLTGSVDPSVTFAELAKLLVPALCEQATAMVHTGRDLIRLRTAAVDSPASLLDQVDRGWVLTVHMPAHYTGRNSTDRNGTHQDWDYVAVVTCSWRGQAPTGQQMMVIELAARHAAALVDHARQARELQRREEQFDSLRVALDSNRMIGAAVGVLMATRRLTYQQGFDLLAKTSQNRNSKLTVVADAVLHTGALPAHP